MLRAVQRYFSGVKPVVIDGALYVLIAMFGTVEGIATSEEIYKYVNPYAVFFLKTATLIALSAVTALKMFRSTSYSDHQAQKKIEADRLSSTGNTELITKP